jgi:hypothetical protein
MLGLGISLDDHQFEVWGFFFFFLFLLGFGVCVRINLWVFFLCSCIPIIRIVSFYNSHFLFRSNRIYCFLKFLWVGLLLF